MFCSYFKGWNQLNHQPVLKFPHFFPASLQAKTAGISKLVDDEAISILQTKNKFSLALVLSNFFYHIFDIILWKHFLEYLQKVNLKVLFGSTYEFLGKFP